MIIAIDGPSGAGKSTIAKEVAKALGFCCLDTGAMYRAVAVYALTHDVSLEDKDALGKIAQTKDIEFGHVEGDPSPRYVYIDGIDVTTDIRTAEIDKAVTPVSQVPAVRAALVEQQQRIGNAGNYVVEGRDIGTVVFPQAETKVFLTASAEERAKRRQLQNIERGVGSTDYEEILADLIRRDEADSTRAISPLKPADDAVLVDSTDMTIDEVIARICDLARK